FLTTLAVGVIASSTFCPFYFMQIETQRQMIVGLATLSSAIMGWREDACSTTLQKNSDSNNSIEDRIPIIYAVYLGTNMLRVMQNFFFIMNRFTLVSHSFFTRTKKIKILWAFLEIWYTIYELVLMFKPDTASDVKIIHLNSCTVIVEKIPFLKEFTALVHDRMTEGEEALKEINVKMGLAFDKQDIDYYTHLFRDDIKRNPTTKPIISHNIWDEPIMFSGAIGQIDHAHISKGDPEIGMLHTELIWGAEYQEQDALL
ncbi:hypothetical protein ACJX0J_010015, partial [Zea mays]